VAKVLWGKIFAGEKAQRAQGFSTPSKTRKTLDWNGFKYISIGAFRPVFTSENGGINGFFCCGLRSFTANEKVRAAPIKSDLEAAWNLIGIRC